MPCIRFRSGADPLIVPQAGEQTSEETLDWLKRFAAYELNDNQRTALVFLREVGAIDAVAYRQLTGCKPKLVAKELAGIKDQGLMIQKGRTRGTYYVPAGRLEESIEDEKHKLISQAIAETTTPRAVITTPPGETTTPQTEITTPLPKDLIKDLENLKQHEPSQRVKKLILRLCEVHPMPKEELAAYLKRSVATVDKYAALMMGKELCFRYPMMPHHPRQAYVALKGFITSYQENDSSVERCDIGPERCDIDSTKCDIECGMRVTFAHVATLRRSLGTKDYFRRSDVLSILEIHPASASRILRKMLNAKIIEMVAGHGKGAYRFKR